MTVQEYIQNRLRGLAAVPNTTAHGKSSEELIRARLMTKKFRKLKATEACEAVVSRVVKKAVEEQLPITVSLLFGGNKLWRFDEAPEVDWAELFSIFYYIDWLKTVAAVHSPGVILDFYSQDVSVESLNNVPRSETDKYSQTFREMLEWLKPYLPDGVTITYRRHFEEFSDSNEYYQELELGKQAVLQENGGQLPTLTEAMRVATELNVRVKPDQEADSLWREKVELEHQAIFRTKTLGKYLSDPGIITISPTNYENADSIITGSTKRSYAKFWAGIGALEKSKDSYHELVLTPKQLQQANFEWVDIQVAGLRGKNFHKIRVLVLR